MFFFFIYIRPHSLSVYGRGGMQSTKRTANVVIVAVNALVGVEKSTSCIFNAHWILRAYLIYFTRHLISYNVSQLWREKCFSSA